VLFVLWDCTCGHKLLERKPQDKTAQVASLALAVAAADD